MPIQPLVTEAAATAAEIAALLERGRALWPQPVAAVEPEKCCLCLTCLRSCPHGAVRIEAGAQAARIESLDCHGCGICVADCPSRAITLAGFEPAAIEGELALPKVSDTLSNSGKKITIFACARSGEIAALAGQRVGAQVKVVPVPCGGSISETWLLKALELGADAVLAAVCYEGSCDALVGNRAVAKRVEHVRKILGALGLPEDKVACWELSAASSARWLEAVEHIAARA